MSAPLAFRARVVSWKDLYLPVPTIRRERNWRPAMMNGSDISLIVMKCAASGKRRSTFDGIGNRNRFGLFIHFIDNGPITFFDGATAQFHGWRQRSLLG